MKTKTAMMLGLAVAMATFALFFLWHQNHILTAAQHRIGDHARVIASSVWTLETSSPGTYLTLATRSDDYARIRVIDESGDTFLDIAGPAPDSLDAVMLKAGLIPLRHLRADIVYEGQTIGGIEATWGSRAVYLYLYILLCLFLLSAGFWLFLKLLESNRTLDSRVRQRTAELEQEIAERRRAERAVRDYAMRLDLHLKHTPLAVIEWNLDFQVTEWNKAAERIFGYPPEEALGKPAWDLVVHPDARSEVEQVWQALKSQTGGTWSVNSNLTKDGTTRICEWYNTTLTGPDGKPIGAASLVLDITDRIKARQALEESEAKYRQLVKHAPAGICEFDWQQARMTSVNDVMSTFTGYTEKELFALSPFSLLAAESRPVLAAAIGRLGSSADLPQPIDLKIEDKNGHQFWILVNLKAFYENGTPRRVLAVIHDLTAIRKAEEDKRKLEFKLIEAQKLESLGTLAGGVAHDFNNLLMGIQGNVSLMLLDCDSGCGHSEKLKHIEAYVKRGVDLTRQLLGLARGGKYEVRPTNLNHLIENSARMFGRTKKEIRIHYHLADDLKVVEVDRGQIEQVLLNLFINAWQAMPDGGDLYLATRNVYLDAASDKAGLKAGPYVLISVSDSGTGIPKEIQQRIFDPFFTTKEVGRGNGMGLASAYGILKNHEGLIDVYSEPGQGSVFSIYLPASQKEIASETKPMGEVVTGSGTILLVDDEEMIVDVGRQMLEKLGYEVVTATSGRAATEIYRQRPDRFDLILLDMIMPEISGRDTFERLKEINPDAAILLSSGYSLNGQASDIIERGCLGFVQKPYNIRELSEKVAQVIRKE